MSCLKIIKLLLIAQAYAFIITVSHEIKSNAKAINGERHLAACHVQDSINIIIPNVEHRMKSSATIIAKNLTSKVMLYVHVHVYIKRLCVHVHIEVMCTCTYRGYVYMYIYRIRVHVHIEFMCTCTYTENVYLYI